MDRHGIVDGAPHPRLGEGRAHAVAVVQADHVLVPHRGLARRLARQPQGQVGEALIIGGGDRPAPGVGLVQTTQLDPEDRRLQLVQAGVHPGLLGHEAPPPAIFAQPPRPRRQLLIAGDQHPGVAEGPEVLGGIEAEGPGRPEAADPAPVHHGAMRLGGVLQHQRAMPFRQGSDVADGGRPAIEMHGDHRADRQRRGPQEPLEGGRIHAEAVGLDVDQHRRGAGQLDGGDRGGGGVRNGGHPVAGPHAQGLEGEDDGVGAAGHADGEAHADELRELLFEGLDLGPEDIGAARQHPGDGGVDLVLLGQVAGLGIGLGDHR